MRPVVIVINPPLEQAHPSKRQGREQRLIKQFVPEATIQALDESVLHWLSGGDTVPFDSCTNLLQQQARFEEFVSEFNRERPHEGLGMKVPADLYSASSTAYSGLPEIDYPFDDRDALVTNCGRICIYRKKINISTVLAGQKLGIKEVDDGIWLVSFMRYNLVYIDLE